MLARYLIAFNISDQIQVGQEESEFTSINSRVCDLGTLEVVPYDFVHIGFVVTER